MATGAKQEISFGLQDSIIRFLKPQKVKFMKKIQLHHSKTTSEERILVVTLWRAHIVYPWLPVKVESSFSYLEVYGITVTDPRQVIIETDRFALSLSLMSLEDLEQVVGHVTSSLKKIFPDSSPGKLLKNSLPDMQERLKSIACSAEGALDTNQGPCGGFSETYAALCDYNEFSCREEIQWDVDNIYHSQENREFNLLDFSHMESRDVALAVAALSFNQWFTKIYCKDFKLSSEVLEQVLYMINRSPKLEEVSLENCGLKMDFALKMAQALREHTCSALHMVTIAGNQIEDRGAAALCQEFENLTSGLAHISFSRCNLSPKGLNALGQALTTNKSFSNSLRYLDLSGNPGLLSTEEANDLFLFLSCSNILTHLDLSATDCPLPPLFVALSVGCCSKLSYLNVSRNIYSHKKARDIPESLKDFFCGCKELKFMGFSGTKIPSEALRILLQSLASNSYLSDLELDLSYCELRSPGAQVIQDHIFEANAIGRLDLSDNGFDSDMVTLVLSIGRSQSIRHLSLGKNFGMKSKALADVLHRIVQLIQEEECPLESLSVAESRLKTGTNVLITALGSNNSLTKIDISGNYMGDMGAKMLAKALQVNTTLGTVIWDRNNTSAAGFLDVAHALERNYTLKCMPIPINDVSQAYRNNPEKTEEAVQKIQAWLQRNNQRQTAVSERAFRLQQGIMTSTSEQLVKRMCAKLEDKVKPLQSFSVKEVQEDILLAEEVLCNARASMTLLPSLYEMGRLTPSAGIVHCRLKKLIDEISQAVRSEMQVLVQTMLDTAEKACPKILHRTKVRERLATYVSKKIVQSEKFVKEAIFQQLGEDVTNKLSELKLSTTVTIAENIIDEMLQDLSASQNKLAQHLLDQTQIVTTRTGEESLLKRNKALFELAETEFPMDEYVPVIRRQTLHTRSIRPTPVIQNQGELDADSQQEDTKGSGGSDQLSVSRPLTKSRPASSEDAALSNSLPPSSEPASPQRLMDLPIEGQRLQHYTRARPRPNRRNKQPPSKPNVQATSCENEENEKYGKVDEGVDDFFAKKLIPEDPLKFLQPVKVQDPVCSTPPSGTRTIKKKFGDFFAFKKPRSSRGQKGEGAPESSPSGGLRLKKTSIADLIRPLREAARAAEKAEESAAKVSTIASTTGPTAVTGTTTTTTATTTTTPTTTTESPAGQLPIRVDREKSKTLESDREKSKTPDAERKLKPSRRSLREGKSQSLILLTGVDEEESLAASHGKKLSEKGSAEGPQTFEQKVHIMLHRIGVTKVLSSDTKKNQNKDGELRKADSEGTIVDSKPQPPPQFITPRTMSTSSDMRRPFRAGHVTEPLRGMDKSCQERTSPALPKAPVKPPVSEIQEHSLEVSPATRMPKPLQEQSPVDSCLTEEGGSLSKCKKETLTPTPSPRRMTGVTEKEKSERAMPVASEDNLPIPRPRVKQAQNRRATSVHEEQLRDQESQLEPKGDNKSEVSIKRCSPENQTASGEVLQTAAKAQQVPQTAQRSLRDQRTDPPVSLKNMN
ncbi:capping protein, Arp2/3 and myosin-I linker protein 2 isoform X5 [Erpetoichthys calabaricus]|uniref:capping protein, Arp2/3 and myosin-I linker protein 2 isoform X5 n=1 Tax=Erpetoichthys calabaricus TaxID=27687 RepID=UPI00223406CE|nr:capping protein, Arp2/3 and myosin-I linker protein 2 isoform X5 [Erpetoichthys calabaricus]